MKSLLSNAVITTKIGKVVGFILLIIHSSQGFFY